MYCLRYSDAIFLSKLIQKKKINNQQLYFHPTVSTIHYYSSRRIRTTSSWGMPPPCVCHAISIGSDGNSAMCVSGCTGAFQRMGWFVALTVPSISTEKAVSWYDAFVFDHPEMLMLATAALLPSIIPCPIEEGWKMQKVMWLFQQLFRAKVNWTSNIVHYIKPLGCTAFFC